MMYDINYKWLSRLSYPEAVHYVQKYKKLFRIKTCAVVVCDHSYFLEGYTFVSKEHLVI